RFVAIVDNRDSRASRAWFGERHEASHLIIPDPGAQVLWRRTTVERPEPLEEVVDSVASHVGFWSPIVRPVLQHALSSSPNILDAFDHVRSAVASAASIESSYRAFARMVSFPLLMIRCDYDCRKSDTVDPTRSWALRAKTIIVNDAAEAINLHVWENYRIPENSIPARGYAGNGASIVGIENLGDWPTKTGRRLPRHHVQIVSRGHWSAIRPV
ncbi:MAG TPA: hypothetical protein VJ891_12070, partial [Casimicrobiaceae bacterium]|nr:hypothetical protein [Casimicrobiaceae bacterium]